MSARGRNIGSSSAHGGVRNNDAVTATDTALLRFGKLVDRELRLRNELSSQIDDARWMILLDIYLAMGEYRDTPFMSAAHASNVPVSTAQRYIHEMIDSGLMLQHRSTADQRITHVSLTEKGCELVTQTLKQILALRTRA